MDIENEVPVSFLEKIHRRLKQVGLEISMDVEKAFSNVPRKYFVPPKYVSQAYTDHPLPIASGQTISAPHMYAMMMSIGAGDPHQGMTILEIGAGSGYGAALLGYVVNPGKVYSVERHKSLVKFARTNISDAGLNNIEIIHGDGTKDIPGMNFDRIIVTAAAQSFPEVYLDHLKIGGKIVIPLCDMYNDQWIWVYTKDAEGTISKKRLMQVVFVPLVF
ncbi:MAG: protein-L-isoaspartate(D-aspartate) O-methyltransferase [Candidatus Heimdallarchaeota archaeon]|nr:protein-L-isoaspartate(D-aspartate) O-methyltransferase [Candidatus Heimdallarchaeota archaeon]